MRAEPTRRSERRQERGDLTRRLIVEEMVRCVIEEGFAAASARRVTERAGVTWGVIQYHFGDRNGLLTAVIDRGMSDLESAMAEVAHVQGPPRVRVAAVVDAAWSAFCLPTSIAALEILIATRGRRDADFERHLREVNRHLTRLGHRVLPELDAPTLSVVWSTLRGMAVVQMMAYSARDLPAQRSALVDMIIASLPHSEQ